MLVNCRSCGYFLPDNIGFGTGIADCKVSAHYKAKGVSLDNVLKFEKDQLGGYVMYPGHEPDRDCLKYKEKISATSL